MTALPAHRFRPSAGLLASLVVGLLLLSAAGASAASAIYMKLSNGSGDYQGESAAPGRPGWSELTSVNFGATNTVNLGNGTGAGKPTLSDVAVTRLVERTSPTLFLAVLAGKVIPPSPDSVVIEFTKTVGSSTVTYLRLQLKNAYVTGQSTSGGSGAGNPTESLSFAFNNIQVTYFPYDSNGQQGTPTVTTWDTVKVTPGY